MLLLHHPYPNGCILSQYFVELKQNSIFVNKPVLFFVHLQSAAASLGCVQCWDEEHNIDIIS